ncbi:hypothetical protein [Yokenella regensburgei]|uniref:hypothetical protein n=1 Tax=Yokenella regensburgei TaxID=158877 RepID=UPI0013756245|nr:hypothetical protein [Yokenella regensburgei]KAF1367512.1 hypothetical protein FHR25_003938 [Yokenella regensburgei]
MTTFTKEQLIEHAKKHIEHAAWMKRKFPDAYKTPATVELARIALAAMQQEPVGQCGICAGCVPQIDGGSGFNNCAEAHEAETAGDEVMQPAPDNKQVDELTMWVKRLAHSLKYANQLSKLPSDAMEYLSCKGLISVEDVLRGRTIAPPCSEPENQRKG